jgi:hypothetical protein
MKRLFLCGLSMATFFMTACNQDQDVNGTGTLSLRIADAPTDAENIAGVYITFDRVEYMYDGKWYDFDNFQGPKTVNLLELTDGKTELLGDFVVNAGEYSNLRFHLDASTNGGDVSNSTTYIQFTDGSKEPLYVPSGTQSGYKSKGSFVVPVNGTVFITADFDVRKSVVMAGSTGKWLLKPVIRLVVTDQAGSITGTLTGINENEEYIVYAYANDTYTEEEAAEPLEGAIQFPNAVTSTRAHADGTFTLAFLAPGTYDLVVAAYANGEFVGGVGQINDVDVVEKQEQQVSLQF